MTPRLVQSYAYCERLARRSASNFYYAFRLLPPAQRRAMALRDKTCRAEGCDTPAAWCEAHHANQPWSTGGRTDLDDGALLCSWHHHRAHDPDYGHQRLPNGDFRFHRQT